ncbi:hypothetical protein VFPPC_16429 [Pochonia chlamydosporia 170]|uniref:AA1-like domain-containing protein n=1 Tax=Pochonia chlamydosporia 170 TaxID=1380566 RepID=A0A179FCC6_METCM|nr:hypothetical protein VFPPC_16429 [Pochonia chlamydosporia 170]OAQ63132.1 hypothetical protein VFPPC_16429 [Pochonia chlamydosporia 170]
MHRPTTTFSRALALTLLALSTVCNADDDDSTPTPTVTTAPIFIPYYSEDQWSVVRGSIISTDTTATQTTYTIFCPTATQVACDLSLEFPFVIVEGPSTLKFHGTLTSTYIADLECKMNGTTAATCSGYSSYRSGYTNGKYTGPTEVSWTSTLTGSNVHWGTLTLADKPTETDDSLDVTGTDIAGPTDQHCPILDGKLVTSQQSKGPSPVGASQPGQRWEDPGERSMGQKSPQLSRWLDPESLAYFHLPTDGSLCSTAHGIDVSFHIKRLVNGQTESLFFWRAQTSASRGRTTKTASHNETGPIVTNGL